MNVAKKFSMLVVFLFVGAFLGVALTRGLKVGDQVFWILFACGVGIVAWIFWVFLSEVLFPDSDRTVIYNGMSPDEVQRLVAEAVRQGHEHAENVQKEANRHAEETVALVTKRNYAAEVLGLQQPEIQEVERLVDGGEKVFVYPGGAFQISTPEGMMDVPKEVAVYAGMLKRDALVALPDPTAIYEERED